MANDKRYIYGFLAKLLRPGNNRLELLSYLPANQGFWDDLVKVGSSHLVLPAIYLNFKLKKISEFLPKQLYEYLKEIQEINFQRNKLITNQIKFISKIFKDEFNYVFIKGSALLFLNDINFKKARMIGDIDLLVEEKNIYKAKQILIENGFQEHSYEKKLINSENNFSKHLNRMTNSNFICAVELHRFCIDDLNKKILDSNDILKSKKMVNGIWIPSLIYLWKISVLNWQYNDHGKLYNYFSFRTILDVFSVQPKNLKTQLLNETDSIRSFYGLIAVFYPEFSDFYSLSTVIYKLKLKYKWFNITHIYIVKTILLLKVVYSRLFLLSSNTHYRNVVLRNPKLIFKKIHDFWNHKQDVKKT